MKRTILILTALLFATAASIYSENWNDRKTPFYSANHITTSATTTVTSATSYVSGIAIAVSNAGTTWTLQIKNKEGTPKILYLNTGTGVAIGTTYVTFDVPVIMTSGIDIVTAGTAGVMDVWVTYWQ